MKNLILIAFQRKIDWKFTQSKGVAWNFSSLVSLFHGHSSEYFKFQKHATQPACRWGRWVARAALSTTLSYPRCSQLNEASGSDLWNEQKLYSSINYVWLKAMSLKSCDIKKFILLSEKDWKYLALNHFYHFDRCYHF